MLLDTVFNKSYKQHLTNNCWAATSDKPSQWVEWDMTGTAGEVRPNSEIAYFNGHLDTDTPVLGDQYKLRFIRSVWTLDAVKRTYREWWPIGSDDKRVNGICAPWGCCCCCWWWWGWWWLHAEALNRIFHYILDSVTRIF